MKSNRTALLPEQRAAIRRALLLDMLIACCVLSSVALFAAGAFSGDSRWIICACGIGGIAVWLTEGESPKDYEGDSIL